jgi:asparagine synthase (glutamine-hydrolysing)
MCGIAGFFNLDGSPADPGVLARMTHAIRHRGPDDDGHVMFSLATGTVAPVADAASSGPVALEGALGFRRLKILDLSEHGHQPMMNDDRSVLLAFNGEIYNAFGFTPELEAAGYRFRSKSDTEVLLNLYLRFGLDGMLQRISGMFAIVIADLRSRELHIVRDHFGVKPIYWTVAGGTLLFASEAKAFLCHPRFHAEIDETLTDEYLGFRFVGGEASLLKGVRQLRPGHRLRLKGGEITTHRYWEIPDYREKATMSDAEVTDGLEEILRGSVQAQLLSDVKVGCQLSGGLDSSLVSVFARSHFGADMDTFSVVFEDPTFSEDRWVSQAAAAARADSHRYMFSEAFFFDTLGRATWHMDQPISHPNSLGIWLLSRGARDLVTVLLSGEGADEVLAGYSRFHYAHIYPKVAPWAGVLGHLPGVGHRFRRQFGPDPVDTFIAASMFQRPDQVARIRPQADLGPAFDRRRALFAEGQADHLSNCLKYEMQTYLVDLLVRQDKMTMAHSLENRVPFLDLGVVDFARRLPARHLVGESFPLSGSAVTKVALKTLARRTFPDSFVDRPKSGFSLPLAKYFAAPPFETLMEDQLLPGMARRGLVDANVVRQMWRGLPTAAPGTGEALWISVALELWAQQIDEHTTRD